MPSADDHQRQADHNLRFLATIDTDEFCDWMAVVAFYVAVHLVEKLRAAVGEHSADHPDRNEFVRAHHHPIHVYYRDLYNISLLVRSGTGPYNWLVPERVSDSLQEIQRYVLASASPPAP
jgi:hypothetical protein